MSDEQKVASPFKRGELKQTLYFQDGVRVSEGWLDRSRPFTEETVTMPLPLPPPPPPQVDKKTYWIDRAQGMWLGFEIVGNGPYVFVSQCSQKVYLFFDRKLALDQRCEAGPNCKLFGCHSRHLLKWYPPVKCGQWAD